MIAYIIKLLFTTYTLLLGIRCIGSWIPPFAQSGMMRFVAYYVDPYLNLFRAILPPLWGALDLSPLLAYLSLHIGERLALFFFA